MIGKLESPEGARQNDGIAPVFALPGWSILSLTGTDALAFAQAQLMNDLTRLADGQWQWNGWLNPKGRVIALCIALRRDAESLWLLLPDMPAEELADGLRRYVFRSKVVLAPLPDWQAAGRITVTCEVTECAIREGSDGALTLPLGPLDDSRISWRQLLLLPPGADAVMTDMESWSRWLLADLRAGLPRLDEQQREQFTPQMLALDRLRAYSVKKGCYPGQEVVSRTHYLGKAKRRLQRFRMPAGTDVKPGVAISNENGEPLSTLLNVVECDGNSEALAILDESAPAYFRDQQLERLPLLDLLPT